MSYNTLSYDEIIYENRNKSYGSFKLRKTELSRLLISTIVGVILFSTTLVSFHLSSQAEPNVIEGIIPDYNITLFDLEETMKDEAEETHIITIKEKIIEIDETPPTVKQTEIVAVDESLAEEIEFDMNDDDLPPAGTETNEGEFMLPDTMFTEEIKEEIVIPKKVEIIYNDIVEIKAVLRSGKSINDHLVSNLDVSDWSDYAVAKQKTLKGIYRIFIDDNGYVVKVIVLRSSGLKTVDDDVIYILKHFKKSPAFHPAKNNGIAVHTKRNVKITMRP